MCPSRLRRLLPAALLLLAVAGCGRTSSNGGAEPVAAASAPTTTASAATPAAGGGDPSPAAGLTAAQLRDAVTAPGGPSTRALGGPVADRVTVGGRTVWRITVPGAFTVRDARVVVEVGDRVVGQGVLTPDLGRLVAVTTDASGLVAGARVAFRYEGSPSVPAGTLAVQR